MAFSSNQLTVPPGFPELLQGLAKEVLRKQPKDIIGFAHEYFATMVNERTAQENLNNAINIENQTTSNKPNKNIIIPTSTPAQTSHNNISNTEQEPIQEQPNTYSNNNNTQNYINHDQNLNSSIDNNNNNNMNEQPNDQDEELPDLNSFDDSEVNAITKIQSGFRGMKARKEVRQQKQESLAQQETTPVVEEEEQLPDLNSFDANEVNAITKIQSGFRGMQARKQVKEMRPVENQEAEQTNPVVEEETEELPDLNSFDANEVNAITKIQSGFRGMQARKEVRNMQDQQTDLENERRLAENTAPPASAMPFSPRNEELPPSTANTNANVLSPRENIMSPHEVNIEKINENEEEELPDLNSFDQNEIEAISKIQAGFRGMQVRKEMREKQQSNEAEEEQPAENNTNQVEEEEELPDLNSFDNDEVNAITKIQAGFRGMQARKNIKKDDDEQ